MMLVGNFVIAVGASRKICQSLAKLPLTYRPTKTSPPARSDVLRRFTHGQAFKSGVTDQLITSLAAVVGNDGLSTSIPVREHHGKDESAHGIHPPDIVVFPESTQQVSELAKICYEHAVPIIPFGAGSGFEGGVTAPQGGVCFDMIKMDQVVSVNAEDFDCTVQPGVTRKYLNDYLRDTGLWFPVDPGADASLCGMCATSASGTNAVRYGTMRENVLNLEVVLADGRIMHTAGEGRRTKKTSAGYNLTNLFVGSEGTLGMFTKATLRLVGQPESIVSAVCHFPSIKAAVDTTVQVMQCGIPVARIELLDEAQIEASNKYSKTDWQVCPSLFFEFHGTENHVDNQAILTKEIAEMNEGSDFKWSKDLDERNRIWKARHECWYACLSLRPGCKAISTDVVVPISELPDVIVKTQEDIKQFGLTGPLLGHVGDGNFHVFLQVDVDNKDEMDTAHLFIDRLAERALAVNGTCTGEHGIGLGKRHLLEKEIGSTGVQVMKQIKQALDPKSIMNPGKIFFSTP